MLNGRLALHDIRDTEAFCTRIIHRSTLRIPAGEHDEALAYLIEEAWILSIRYTPNGKRFSSSAGHLLGLRLIDWHRTRNGQHYRTGNTPPTHTPLTDAHPGSNLDPAEHSPADLIGLLRSRASTPPPGHPENPRRLARTTTR